MSLQVVELEDLEERVSNAIDRIGELQAGSRVQSTALLSEPFVDDHTEFGSFAEFCEQSPWALDEGRDVREVPRDRLDEYVAEHTDFGSWEAMRTRAAEEEIIDQVVA